MKKFLLILLLNVTVFDMSLGQQFTFGVKPSFLLLNSKLIADLTGYPCMEVKPRSSYGIGLTFSKQIRQFGIAAEPRFIAKGYKLDFGSNDFDIYRNNYLSLPVLLSFSPAKNLNLEIGPEFAYLVNSKIKFSYSNSVIENDSKNLRSFELSLITGVRYSLIKRLDLGLRYGLGLTPYDIGQFIVNDAPYYMSRKYKYIHRYFELFLATNIFIKNN